MNRLLTGALAGLIATVPMSLAMDLLRRRLPPRERYRLPPRQITDRLLRRVGLHQTTGEDDRQWLTLATHFGYGAAVGAVYAAAPARAPVPRAISGPIFGLVVWAASYMAWLPLVGLFHPATDEPAGRNWLMIGAHLVWGGALGMLVPALGSGRSRPADRVGGG